MAAHHVTIEVLIESLLQRGKKALLGKRRRRVARRGDRRGARFCAGRRIGQGIAPAAETKYEAHCQGFEKIPDSPHGAQISPGKTVWLFVRDDSSRSPAALCRMEGTNHRATAAASCTIGRARKVPSLSGR